VLPRSHLTIVTKGTTMMPKAHNRTKTVVGHATKAPPTRCCSPHRTPATATGGVAADAIVAETATAEAATAAISGHQSHKPRPPGANQATRAQILPPQGRNRARPATADGAPPNHTASGPRGGRSSTRGGGFGQPQGGSGRSPPEPVEEAAAKDATREDSKGGKGRRGGGGPPPMIDVAYPAPGVSNPPAPRPRPPPMAGVTSAFTASARPDVREEARQERQPRRRCPCRPLDARGRLRRQRGAGRPGLGLDGGAGSPPVALLERRGGRKTCLFESCNIPFYL
jgi:hypothetical protein